MPSKKNTINKLNKIYAQSFLETYTPVTPVLKKIDSIIQKQSKFLLTTHVNSDLDGVGSQIGLYYLLKSLGKTCKILNNEALPFILKEYVKEDIVTDIQQYADDLGILVDVFKSYFVFILDSSELSRSHHVADLITLAQCQWATIDHHTLPPQKNYCIDDTYAATCEMIWDLFHYYKKPIPQEVAIPLYLGIVADSGGFRYNKTSFRTHMAGAELLSYNLDSDFLYRLIYENYPIDRFTLITRVLQELTINRQLGYVVGEVTDKTTYNLNLGVMGTEGIVNMLLEPNDVQVAALTKPTDMGELKCSLRSKGDVDVSVIAHTFGGGGHKNASGLRISQPYKKAKKQLIKTINEYLSTNHPL